MARLFRDENDINVWRALIGAFSYLDMMASDAQLPAMAAAVREILGPAFARLGWDRRPAKTNCAAITGNARRRARHPRRRPDVQARARELYEAWQREPVRANRDLQPAFVSILAHSGDAARYQEFKQHFKSARTPQEEQRFLFSLANFRKIDLLRQTMEMTLNGEVRTQNAPFLMHSLLYNRVSRYEAWEFIKANWETMVQ